MAQLFGPRADRRMRRIAVLVIAGIVAVLATLFAYERSGTRWDIGKARAQPIAFRHDLHSTALGIGCSYCHTTAQKEAAAGMPSVQTCMTCHSQIWRGTPHLEPLRQAALSGRSIQWQSVSRLPSHSRFHHGSHTAAGVACATCHGAVERMQETTKAETLSMGWCVQCHKAPERQGVPPAPAAARIAGRATPAAHRDGRDLTDCAVCHY